MASIHDIPANKLTEELAVELKSIKELTPPEWSIFVKTGSHKERPPVNPDWWYVRSASILRTIYKNGPVGVSKLRSKYGGRKNRGSRPEKFTKGSGSVIRKILQQLQTAQLVSFKDKGVSKGRIISPKGQAILDKVSNKLAKELKIKIEVKQVTSKAKKPIIKEAKKVEAPVEEKEKKTTKKKPSEKKEAPKKEDKKSESKPKEEIKEAKE